MLSPKANQIRQMFSSIAPWYDFLNHLLSLNFDRSWRRQAVSVLSDKIDNKKAQCLDLCCGTGDLTVEIIKQGTANVISTDFSHSMLVLNSQKTKKYQLKKRVQIIETDALKLPFQTESFDALGIAFGLRNLENYSEGLLEMFRVLKPKGRIVILEFSKPNNFIFNKIFQFYFLNILPAIGKQISGHQNAYHYLPDSVTQFPDQIKLCKLLLDSGFSQVNYMNLSGGIAAIHSAIKS